MDKHERPYKCLEKSCHNRTFPDKGGLRRHQRSVHGKPLFVCPVTSCERHKKGFARKDNLNEHWKRVHPTQPMSGHFGSRINRSGQLDAEVVDSSCISSSGNSDADQNGTMDHPIRVPIMGLVEAHALEAKLEELNAERTRRLEALDLKSLDEDIMAVERTLALCGATA
jgi:hypothetical protein